ncbi:putative N-acetylmuramoyl-L-alanine amidase CwlD [Selenomonas sp. FOBRC6]|uniref:N-acetylmuramoyl-L-alanine amidase n=1 Tax=Selenomonas sp. FOBRC6 TaxID=936572 RepID=UPI000277F0A6|nr:N-acetylmuramoyl-L-alanine amidase [Selenomonas sp. FOBRC6]EJO17657.1 putative N-acetylmuramoyl-L-alanine amidase CwlD [Selenomonas sp. FOBRC6]
MRRIFLLLTVVLVAVLGVTFAVHPAEAAFSDRAKDLTKIAGVRIGKTDGNVRIVIDADRPVSYKQSVLSNPMRIVLDIQNAWIAPEAKKNTTVDSALVSGVRVAQFDATTVRIVVETSVGKDGYKIFSLDAGKPRVVMDFGAAPSGSAVKKPAQETMKPVPVQPPQTDDEDVQDADNQDQIDRDLDAITGMKGRKIAIDPGHGGSDSGAIGPTGIMEKSVTLRVSRELKRLLEAEGATVILTRTGDTEVSSKGANATSVEELEARCEIANRANADIFLSIHADAFTNREVKGTTAYYYTKGTKQSKRLADSVRTALIDSIGTVDRGTQTSNFYVVKHTDMPAILVEISFISNPDEEKMMNSPEGIKKIAQGIADGIADYFG